MKKNLWCRGQGLLSIIYKGLLQSEEKRANNAKEIMAEDMNRQFTKEWSQMATNKWKDAHTH